MKNGIVLPFPKRETDVSFNELGAGVLGFQISVDDIEYISVSDAAKMLGVTKDKVKELVETLKIKKRCSVGDRYLLLKSDIEKLIENT